jgi:hypothetical protein
MWYPLKNRYTLSAKPWYNAIGRFFMNKFCQFLKNFFEEEEDPKSLIGKKMRFTENERCLLNPRPADNATFFLKPGTYVGTIMNYWPSKSGKCEYCIQIDFTEALALWIHITSEKGEKVEIL